MEPCFEFGGPGLGWGWAGGKAFETNRWVGLWVVTGIGAGAGAGAGLGWAGLA